MVHTNRLMSALLLSLLLALSACGGAATTSNSSPAGGGQTTSASPTTTDTHATSGVTATTETGTTGSDAPAAGGTLVIYSGRSEDLVGPLIEQFEQDTGVDVQVKYGGTSELAASLLEEGEASPADIFFAQDAGALGAVSDQGMLVELPESILSQVDGRFKADNNQWVGVSGRARVVVYNPELVQESDLPASILDFTDPKWKGKLGWAPTNGSFQAFVTALRQLEGDEQARAWLEGIQANEPKVYPNNTAIVQAVASGEISAGFVNHYYLARMKSEDPSIKAENYFFKGGDPGSLVNVAGVGILKISKNTEAAEAFVSYLLSEKSQQYFSQRTFEYPIAHNVEASENLLPLEQIQSPEIDLSNLDDLDGTLQLLQDTGVL